MCEITTKYKKNTATGYKVVIQTKRGILLSPFTSIKYKIGRVPKIRKSKRLISFANYEFNTDNILTNINDYYNFTFNILSYGKTGILISKSDAKELLNIMSKYTLYNPNHTLIIVKMKISGNLYNGYMITSFNNLNIIAGEYINKISLI